METVNDSSLSPLSERVVAPADLRRPADADGITWRASTIDDVPAIHDCVKESAAIDHPHYTPSEEEISEDFEVSHVDPALDTILGTDADGRVIAWGVSMATATAETIKRVILSGGVRPSHRGRGIGRQLLEWQDGRGMQHLAASSDRLPGWLMGYLDPDRQADAAHLFERRGYRLARYFLELRRDLAAPIEPREPKGDLRIEQYGPELSEATRLAANDSFRDHWGSQPQNEEVWAKHRGVSVMRNDLSFVAIGTNAAGEEEVAGFVLTVVQPDDFEGQGFSSSYVELVGTRREWRGRGIAPALLTRVLEATKADGIDKVVLDVDAENPTGALGLYTSLGFEESNRTVSYVREF